jgi:hypothetical protein
MNRVKGVCVIKYLCNATLNCTFLFIRLVRLDGGLLKILMSCHSSENMRGWQLVYVADTYSLC